MARVRFIRIDDDFGSQAVREFDNSTPYEGLKPGEVIDVDCEDGNTKEYYVEQMHWDFTHFGNTLEITIRPCKPKPKPVVMIDNITGSIIQII